MDISEKLDLIKEVKDETVEEFADYCIEYRHVAELVAQLAATKMLNKLTKKLGLNK